MTRNGKIARLPRAIRDELNRRLDDGEPGLRLVVWLNGLPEVKEIMARDFGGRGVNVDNLGEWRRGGFREWVALRELAVRDGETGCGGTGEPAGRSDGVSAGNLADSVEAAALASYEAMFRSWNGVMTSEINAMLRGLSTSLRDVARLRRGQLALERIRENSSIGRERLALDRERLELERSKLERQKSKGLATEETENSQELSVTMSHEERAILVKQMFNEATELVQGPKANVQSPSDKAKG